MIGSFLEQADIDHWGMKAASLRFFITNNLYHMATTFFDAWKGSEQCIQQLRADGLKEQGWGMSVRFSARSNGLYQLHKWAMPRYVDVAAFIEEHQDRLIDGTFIVIEAEVPEYMGEMLKRPDGTYHAEIVPGTWITSGIEPTDYVDIVGNDVIYAAYQRPRRVLARLAQDEQGEVMMGKFVDRTDPPVDETMAYRIASQLHVTAQHMSALGLPDMMYEFNMNANMRLHIREAKVIDMSHLESVVRHSETTFEIDTYERIDQWNGRTPLYLSVGVEKTTAHRFQELIEKLKGRATRVYVRYGILTHPAILLREAGIQPVSLRSQYTEYEFKFHE